MTHVGEIFQYLITDIHGGQRINSNGFNNDSSGAMIGQSSCQSSDLSDPLFNDQKKTAKPIPFPSAFVLHCGCAVQPHKAAGVAVDSKPYFVVQ